jgi:hypothetical protein
VDEFAKQKSIEVDSALVFPQRSTSAEHLHPDPFKFLIVSSAPRNMYFKKAIDHSRY